MRIDVKIFLSSPGDVKEERDIVEAVVEELQRDPEFKSDFALELFRWDDKNEDIPMEATETPQIFVNRYTIKPSACDLVIVIFWSRMGTPVHIEGRDYLSGTHYEYSDAVEEYRRSGKPSVWVYRRMEEPIIGLKDPLKHLKLAQYERLEQFFASFSDEEGRAVGGINEYETPTAFRDKLKKQLQKHLRYLRKPLAQAVSKPERQIETSYIGQPYRGLLSLGINDGDIFFGRELETLDVLAQLEQTRLMFIVGASGSGKSSLAAAGVAARLKARGGWQIVHFTPGEDPFYNLVYSLFESVAAVEQGAMERMSAVEKLTLHAQWANAAHGLAPQLRANPECFDKLLDGVLPQGTCILILADQFEELFSLAAAGANGAGVVQCFAELLRRLSKVMTILATMRADFMEAAIPYFEHELRKGAAFTLGKPSSVALYEMILRPAQLARIELDDGLAQRIAEDAGTQPGALALVAYLLEQLHKRSPHRLRFSDYDDLGGVEQAIGTRAEDVFSELKLADKESLLYSVFRDLVVVNEGGVATRQIASYNSFNTDEKLLVDRLTEARLLVNDSGSVEVAHEAVFRSWERLKKWIEDEQEDLILLRQMRSTAAEWQKKGTPDLLWTYELQKPVFAMIARHRPKLDPHERQFMIPEYQRLLDELRDPKTSPKRRRTIGERLAALPSGDPRRAIGVEGDVKAYENDVVIETLGDATGLHQNS